MSEDLAIGIDLGTTYSCAALYYNGKVHMIKNEYGYTTTPSYVNINQSELVVGEDALQNADKYPKNTIYDAKRMIGRKYDELDASDLERWPFDASRASGSGVKVQVGDASYRPEQISAMVLARMKELAELHVLNECGRRAEIVDAVVTVPAHFDQAQRLATMDAARVAGLRVLQLLVEPTAAATAYGLQNEFAGRRNVLVYDLGGGTFDVSVVAVDGRDFRVLATEGDAHLGGEDFDHLMVDALIERYDPNGMCPDAEALASSRRRLRLVCEAAKRELSERDAARIALGDFYAGDDLDEEMTRDEFERRIEPLVDGTLRKVDAAVAAAGVDVHEVVLVGGSSRIPLVRRKLEARFGRARLNMNINPDEAVAYGAAVLAHSLIDPTDAAAGVAVVDITPLSIGVDKLGVEMWVFIKKGTRIPCEESRVAVTVYKDQTAATFTIFEGERPLVADNRQIGELSLNNLPPGPAGSVEFDCKFKLDANGMLSFDATEKSTGKGRSVEISYKNSRLSEEDINRMIREAERFKADDAQKAAKAVAKKKLEIYCSEMKKVSKNSSRAYIECGEVLDWIDDTPEATKGDYEIKLSELEKKYGKPESSSFFR